METIQIDRQRWTEIEMRQGERQPDTQTEMTSGEGIDGSLLLSRVSRWPLMAVVSDVFLSLSVSLAHSLSLSLCLCLCISVSVSLCFSVSVSYCLLCVMSNISDIEEGMRMVV